MTPKAAAPAAAYYLDNSSLSTAPPYQGSFSLPDKLEFPPYVAAIDFPAFYVIQ